MLPIGSAREGHFRPIAVAHRWAKKKRDQQKDGGEMNKTLVLMAAATTTIVFAGGTLAAHSHWRPASPQVTVQLENGNGTSGGMLVLIYGDRGTDPFREGTLARDQRLQLYRRRKQLRFSRGPERLSNPRPAPTKLADPVIRRPGKSCAWRSGLDRNGVSPAGQSALRHARRGCARRLQVNSDRGLIARWPSAGAGLLSIHRGHRPMRQTSAALQ